MVNDKAWGGAFVSNNGGLAWTQKSAGLEAHDVLSLGQASDGTILAGTRHGIYRLNGELWSKVDKVSLELPVTEAPPVAKPVTVRKKGAAARKVAPKAAPAKKKPARDGQQVFAATADGILSSQDGGQSWTLSADPQGHVWYTIASSKGTVLATSLSKASLTTDGGHTWAAVNPPSELTQISAVAVDGFGGLWIGGREGVYLSEDKGASWQVVKNLFVRDVNSLFYDEKGERVLITANSSTKIAFAAHLPDKKVTYWNTGWDLRLMRPVGDHMVAATLFDGVVIQPEMVNSSEVAKH
jgi:ligand-binding sensor domain-containing protein